MKLIPISPNVLINPCNITCVEQKDVKGTAITYVWLGDKHYILTIPLDEFYKSIEDVDEGEINTFFAG